LLLVVMKGAEF